MNSVQAPTNAFQWTWRKGVFQAKRALRSTIKRVVRTTGYDIVPYYGEARTYPIDFTPDHISIINAVRPYTLTSPERIYAVIESVSYIAQRKIPGCLVECGVWRGGSMMAAAMTLKNLNIHDRDLYLFDTFEGMPKPEAVDIDVIGNSALPVFARAQTGEDSSESCFAALSDVQTALASTGYDPQRVHFIKGKVEDTIPAAAPDRIALLRLDTDWYASTRHELEQLYPRLSPGGILIIDDYGYWQGARKATEEYFAKHAPPLFLSRIDDTARIVIKPN